MQLPCTRSVWRHTLTLRRWLLSRGLTLCSLLHLRPGHKAPTPERPAERSADDEKEKAAVRSSRLSTRVPLRLASWGGALDWTAWTHKCGSASHRVISASAAGACGAAPLDRCAVRRRDGDARSAGRWGGHKRHRRGAPSGKAPLLAPVHQPSTPEHFVRVVDRGPDSLLLFETSPACRRTDGRPWCAPQPLRPRCPPCACRGPTVALTSHARVFTRRAALGRQQRQPQARQAARNQRLGG